MPLEEYCRGKFRTQGDATFGNDVTVTNDLTVSNNATVTGTLTVTGGISTGYTEYTDVNLGTIAATHNAAIFIAPKAITITAIEIIAATSVTANDTNYWTFAVTNKDTDGTGSTAMLAATDANTTKATGGSGLTAADARALTLHGTAANLNVAVNEVMQFTATKSAAATDLDGLYLRISYTEQ